MTPQAWIFAAVVALMIIVCVVFGIWTLADPDYGFWSNFRNGSFYNLGTWLLFMGGGAAAGLAAGFTAGMDLGKGKAFGF